VVAAIKKMIKKLFIIIVIIIACLTGINFLSAQDVGLSAQLLSGGEAKLYYFAGAKTDSLASTIGTPSFFLLTATGN